MSDDRDRWDEMVERHVGEANQMAKRDEIRHEGASMTDQQAGRYKAEIERLKLHLDYAAIADELAANDLLDALIHDYDALLRQVEEASGKLEDAYQLNRVQGPRIEELMTALEAEREQHETFRREATQEQARYLAEIERLRVEKPYTESEVHAIVASHRLPWRPLEARIVSMREKVKGLEADLATATTRLTHAQAQIVQRAAIYGESLSSLEQSHKATIASLTAAKARLEERVASLEKAAALRRNTLIYPDCKKEFVGNWVAVPEEDFNALRDALNNPQPAPDGGRS